MEPTTIDDLLRELIEYLLKLWNQLPRFVKEQVREEWKALLAALYKMRGAGVGTRAEWQAILEALKRFLQALGKAGWGQPGRLVGWVEIIQEEAGVAGAGLTAAAVVLWLIAILAWIKSIYEMKRMYGNAAPPVGGAPCGSNNPIARGLSTTGWSLWGELRAFEDAEENARALAQTYTCSGAPCASGTCRGNCAIQDITYKWRFLWTSCVVTFDVWCECY